MKARLRPANIARLTGSIVTLARTVERRADYVDRIQATGGNVGSALLAVEDAINDLQSAFSTLCSTAAEETIDHPIGARAHAAAEAVHAAALAYGDAALARARAWHTKAPAPESTRAPHPDTPLCLACSTNPQEVGRAGLCAGCDAEQGL